MPAERACPLCELLGFDCGEHGEPPSAESAGLEYVPPDGETLAERQERQQGLAAAVADLRIPMMDDVPGDQARRVWVAACAQMMGLDDDDAPV
jgi:hypothetical protein